MGARCGALSATTRAALTLPACQHCGGCEVGEGVPIAEGHRPTSQVTYAFPETAASAGLASPRPQLEPICRHCCETGHARQWSRRPSHGVDRPWELVTAAISQPTRAVLCAWLVLPGRRKLCGQFVRRHCMRWPLVRRPVEAQSPHHVEWAREPFGSTIEWQTHPRHLEEKHDRLRRASGTADAFPQR